MRHEWIFDVLTDLKTYAHKNGLTGLVAAVDEAMQVAQVELRDAEGRGRDALGSLPPGGRAN
ncbi:MAG: hypothetical protein V4712_07360 [Pseudomonadota bacterium]